MNLFKKLFKKKVNPKKIDLSALSTQGAFKLPPEPDLNKINDVKPGDVNNFIVGLDTSVAKLCDYGKKLDSLTAFQKIFYLNQALEMEINNGGFAQFFVNSSGDYSKETVKSLKAVGAIKTAKLLQEAIDKFPNGFVPKDRAERNKIFDRLPEKIIDSWSKLDNKFFQYEDDLNTMNFKYIKQNVKYFK